MIKLVRKTPKNRSVEELIIAFCDIILTEKDRISNSQVISYVDSLTFDEMKVLEEADEKICASIVRKCLLSYIQMFQKDDLTEQSLASPFEFDSGNNLKKYKDFFEEIYISKVNAIKDFGDESKKEKELPKVFIVAFELIQEMSEHYRIFEQFYIIRSQETSVSIISKTKELAKEQSEQVIKQSAEVAARKAVADAAKKAAEEAASQAMIRINIEAQNTAKSVKKITEETKVDVKNSVESEIKIKMADVTQKISETTVTILGIFSGIVLTIVAGLVYSSSVLDNINSANFFRLISASGLVGLVCFDLIVVLFLFVERMRNDLRDKIINEKLVITINKFLLVIIILFSFLQFALPEQITNENINKMKADYTVDINFVDDNSETIEIK